MSGHLADFNILHTKQQHHHANSCSVVINNNNIPHRGKPKGAPSFPPIPHIEPNFGYPGNNGLYGAPSMFDGSFGHSSGAGGRTPIYDVPGYPGGYPPGQENVVSREVNNNGDEAAAETPTVDVEALTQESNLYKAIAQTFGHILKDNNAKLIANLIDSSGKVICDAVSLVSIIAIHTNMPVEQVTITYEDTETGCLAKVNPIRKIKSIKIASMDFNLAYNQKYNVLTDQYFVSLEKVLIEL